MKKKKKRHPGKLGAPVFVHPSSRRSDPRVNRFAVAADAGTEPFLGRRCRANASIADGGADQSSPGGRLLLDSTGKQTVTPIMIHRPVIVGTEAATTRRKLKQKKKPSRGFSITIYFVPRKRVFCARNAPPPTRRPLYLSDQSFSLHARNPKN